MTAHEDLCAERYRTIAETLTDLKNDSKEHRKLLMTVLVGIAGSAVLVLVAVVLKAANLS